MPACQHVAPALNGLTQSITRLNHFVPEVNPQQVVGSLTYWKVRGLEILYVVVSDDSHAQTLFFDAPSLDIYYWVGENRIVTRFGGVSHYIECTNIDCIRAFIGAWGVGTP